MEEYKSWLQDQMKSKGSEVSFTDEYVYASIGRPVSEEDFLTIPEFHGKRLLVKITELPFLDSRKNTPLVIRSGTAMYNPQEVKVTKVPGHFQGTLYFPTITTIVLKNTELTEDDLRKISEYHPNVCSKIFHVEILGNVENV